MTRRRIGAFALATVLLAVCVAAGAEPVIVVFYETDCPNCEIVEALIDDLVYRLPADAVRRIEIHEPGALDLLERLERAYEIRVEAVPVVFVGDAAIVGAGRAQEFELRDAIGRCSVQPCPSPLARVAAPPFPWRDALVLALFAALFAGLWWWQRP